MKDELPSLITLDKRTMKTQTQGSETSEPQAQGNTVTGEVQSEVTFLWAEADE
jgi:hypothetical protein